MRTRETWNENIFVVLVSPDSCVFVLNKRKKNIFVFARSAVLLRRMGNKAQSICCGILSSNEGSGLYMTSKSSAKKYIPTTWYSFVWVNIPIASNQLRFFSSPSSSSSSSSSSYYFFPYLSSFSSSMVRRCCWCYCVLLL